MKLLVLLMLVGSAAANTDKGAFDEWLSTHGLSFATEEEYAHRLQVWGANLLAIEAHNRLHAAGSRGWSEAMNEFGHLTHEEFAAQFSSGYVAATPEEEAAESQVTFTPPDDFVAPDAVDWSTKGAVTGIKNQKRCGSCWTFSATGALEGVFFLKTGNLTSFSEQEFVSCDHGTKLGHGCHGGRPAQAFKWLSRQEGMCTEQAYPYNTTMKMKGKTPACSTACKPVPGSKTVGAAVVKVNETVAELMAAVVGRPISVTIQASQKAFHFYKSGVMDGKCGTKLDHSVLLVGYGTDGGKDYWKIKNSWGAVWGEKGYVRILRGVQQEGGNCGLEKQARYPILA